MHISIRKGTTNKRIPIIIIDATTGEGMTGIVFNSSGLNCFFWREDDGNVNATSINLVGPSVVKGIYTSGGLLEKDSSGMPGLYEFGIPNEVLDTGANWVNIRLQGVINMMPVDIEIELDAVKNLDISELAQANPSATPDYDAAIALIYAAVCKGEVDVTDNVWTLKNDAGTVIIKRTNTKTSTQFTRGKMESGP